MEHDGFVKCRELEGLEVKIWGFLSWVIEDEDDNDDDEGSLVTRAIERIGENTR